MKDLGRSVKGFINGLYSFIFQPKPSVEEKRLNKNELIGFIAMLLLLGFLGISVLLWG